MLLAYFFRHFVHLILAYTIVTSSLLLFFWIIPESPRWLLTKKRYPEALAILKRIAKSNGKSADCLKELDSTELKIQSSDSSLLDPLAEQVPLQAQESNEPPKTPQKESLGLRKTFIILFTSKRIILLSFTTLINWLTNNLVYYGISYNTSDLAGDPYINFTISAILELGAILLCQFTLERFGRKKPYCTAMLVAGTSLLLIGIVPSSILTKNFENYQSW